jgi:hypothetical protein
MMCDCWTRRVPVVGTQWWSTLGSIIELRCAMLRQEECTASEHGERVYLYTPESGDMLFSQERYAIKVFRSVYWCIPE